MTLFMLRLDPDHHAAARWFAAEGLLNGRADDGAYRWHALLTATFGKALAPKPFHVLARRNRPTQLLAYTIEPPEKLDEAARSFADPLALAALGLGKDPLAAKSMPLFAANRLLRFSVLVRPTVRIDRDGDRNRTEEGDAYALAVRRALAAALPKPDRTAVYRDWLAQKLEAGGARPLDIALVGLHRIPSLRRNGERRLVPVEGHSAAMTGVLEVTDADRFAALLARGIGRHRAFGYGMLLLQPC
jgi:CRISPR system Cascade subunit CasE